MHVFMYLILCCLFFRLGFVDLFARLLVHHGKFRLSRVYMYVETNHPINVDFLWLRKEGGRIEVYGLDLMEFLLYDRMITGKAPFENLRIMLVFTIHE